MTINFSVKFNFRLNLICVNRFVFMALMEYCLVNIVLGDSDGPKSPPEPPKPDRIFDLAARVRIYPRRSDLLTKKKNPWIYLFFINNMWVLFIFFYPYPDEFQLLRPVTVSPHLSSRLKVFLFFIRPASFHLSWNSISVNTM